MTSIISFPEKIKLTPKIGLYLFESGYSILLFGLWIKLGFNARKPKDGMCEAWALAYNSDERCVVVNYGLNNKVFYMPWDLIRVECEVLTNQATFAPFIIEEHPHFNKMLDIGKYRDDRAMFEAPFAYVTKKGEAQKTRAIFYVTTSVFKWKIFSKSGFGPAKVTREINVTFKNEIGEGVGTWRGGKKGGTFEMTAEDATPFHTLHRINMTKRF